MKTAFCTMEDILEAITKINPYDTDLYKEKDDITAGRLFSDTFSKVVRFNETADKWFYFDGVIWKKDPRGLVVEGLAQDLQRALQIYSARVNADNHFNAFVFNLSKKHKRETMIKDAKSYNVINNDMLDADRDLLNVKNCVINLRTFEIIEHTPELLLSKVSNVVYNPGIKSPDFEKFISEIMQDEEDKIHYLQKLHGYCLTAETNREECYIYYGATTRNGKSTLLETMSYMLGDYSLNADSDSFTMTSADARSAKSDIARLHGARLVHVSEAQKKMKLNGALIKSLTGQDKQTARFLYESEFEFYPVLKLIFNTNYLPQTNDMSLFTSGRMVVVPFERHFEDSEQDKGLKERLKSEVNLSGILNWCLDGLKSYRKEGLTPPDSIKKATEDYKNKSDKLKQFIDDCLEPVSEPMTAQNGLKGKDVYTRYVSWCKANGYGVEGKTNFNEGMRSKGVMRQGTVNGVSERNAVIGYRLVYD